MAKDSLTYWDYLRAAFTHGPRVPLLGRMPFNQLGLFTFGLLGLVNPGFWLVGAALEAGYLGALSSNARFQNLVRGERLLRRQQAVDRQVRGAVSGLSLEARDRYRRLLRECSQILGLAPGSVDREFDPLPDARAGSLNQLLSLFLRLLASRQIISATLTEVERAALEAEIASLRRRTEAAPAESALARSLAATLEIQVKRLANLDRAQGSLQVIDAELDRIERQVRLIREESAVGGGPEQLSTHLDAVSRTLAETTRWMEENAEILGSLGPGSEATEAGEPILPSLGPVDELTPPPGPRGSRRGQREQS